MKKLFGTDGMRGKAGSFPLDERTIHTTGASLALHLTETLGRSPSIIIGRDTRESGVWLENALVAGALAAGASCQSAGVIPTPGVAYLARTSPADAGVVISASHNEYKDNGIKIFAPSGKKIDEKTERLIEADIYSNAADDIQKPADRRMDQQNSSESLQENYLRFLQNEIGRDLSLKGLKIVIDCANGASSALAPQLFHRLGASVIAINNNPDGRNINLNCGSLHIEGLQQTVATERADLGVAFDGDADRSLFVDHDGSFVDGDATLWVLAKHMDQHGELVDSTIVATVMSNIGLELALRSKDLRLVRTDVGDKHVLEELLRSGTTLGGEQSGHIIFPRLSLAGDGMLTTLRMLKVMQETRMGLSELTQGLERYPQILINVPVREKPPFSAIPGLSQVVSLVERRLGETGRLLLRYSGTEFLARIMIEGRTQSEIEGYAEEIADVIRKGVGAAH